MPRAGGYWVAIAEMRKLNLVAMACDKDKILNALHKTGAVEVTTHKQEEGLSFGKEESRDLKSYLSRMEAALDILSSAVEAGNKERKIKSDVLKDGFDVSYSTFMAAKDDKLLQDKVVESINSAYDEKIRLESELTKVQRQKNTSYIYSEIEMPLGFIKGTAHTGARLGVCPLADRQKLMAEIGGIELADIKEIRTEGEEVLYLIVWHKKAEKDVEAALSSVAFAACPYCGEQSGKDIYEKTLEEEKNILKGLKDTEESLYSMKDAVRPLKIYCDFVSFEIEKKDLSQKFLTTASTFLLEAYIPKGAEENIEGALEGITAYFEFTDPEEDEMPPTLMKNNKVVSNFETITNMYSPPNAKEMDPTTIMALFYSVFMGFIMADVGYGLIMLIGGAIIYYKTRKRKSGLNSLSGVFAVGGIFAIIMGVLYNSWFGWAFKGFPQVIPDAQHDMWHLLGIGIPAVLIIALIIGCVQLCAGYVCKAIQLWRRGEIIDGIFQGCTWAIFAIGVALAIVGLLEEANCRMLAYVGGIMAGVCLVLAALTAGRHEKIIGKFTKGFGAVYGIINFASDILSYARLYGLMLSGAVIASLVSQTYGIPFLISGNAAKIILGVFILIIGHGFNLAMNLLSAYIHDARLQYVEFYGKFYEGEGELFSPIGSKNRHIYLNLEKEKSPPLAAANKAGEKNISIS